MYVLFFTSIGVMTQGVFKKYKYVIQGNKFSDLLPKSLNWSRFLETLFFTGKKLDIPMEINCKSKLIKIKNNTVIDLWYKLIHGSKENVYSFFNNYLYKNNVKKTKIKINKRYKIFTFPDSKNFQDLKKNKVKFLSVDNIKKLILFNE